MTVHVYPHMVKITQKGEQLLLYKFSRANKDAEEDEANPLLKPENFSMSRALFEHLDSKFGFVKDEVSYGGHRITCECDNPMLHFERQWSDGPSKHHWYTCKNCDTRGAIGTNHHGNLTSEKPFIKVADKNEA